MAIADRTPTVASGATTTNSGIASTRLKVDMGNLYMYEAPGELYTTMSMLKKEQAHNKTIQWHTNELVPKFARINGGTLTDSTTTLTVDSPQGNYVQPNFLIEVTRTKEQMVTTTGGSATTIVVVGRSWGPTAAAALLDNDEIQILGPAYGEGGSLQSAMNAEEANYTNEIQTVRHNWDLAGLMLELSKNGGVYHGDLAKERRKLMLDVHKRDLDQMLLFAESGTSGDQATMQGLIPFIRDNASSNVNTATTLTEPVFEDGNQTFFRGGQTSKRVYLSSQKVHGILNRFPSVVQRTKPGDTKFGLRLASYMSAHGDVKIVRETNLEGDEYSKYLVGFDPSMVVMHVVRDTRMLKDRQGTSEDAYEEEVITDISAEWGHPEHCYMWTDIAA